MIWGFKKKNYAGQNESVKRLETGQTPQFLNHFLFSSIKRKYSSIK